MKQWMAVALLIFAASCAKVNEGSKVPKISFEGVNGREVTQGSSEDTVRIAIGVEDGNADLPNDGETPVIFIKDSRYPDAEPKGYIPPPVDEVFMDPAYGFNGLYTVDLPAAFLIFRDTLNNRQRDTLEYEVYIKDKAGNESNRIKTGEIYIVNP